MKIRDDSDIKKIEYMARYYTGQKWVLKKLERGSVKFSGWLVRRAMGLKVKQGICDGKIADLADEWQDRAQHVATLIEYGKASPDTFFEEEPTVFDYDKIIINRRA